MRKENYLIAMLNKGILKLSLPLPFLGSRGRGTLWATTGQQYLTKSLEWSVHFCVLNHMFSDKVCDARVCVPCVCVASWAGLRWRVEGRGVRRWSGWRSRAMDTGDGDDYVR